jgi:Holliday junction resolvase
MANRAKAKGDAAERAVAATLNAAGIPSRRMPAGAASDRGDLWVGERGVYVIDVKDRADWGHLGQWGERLASQITHQAAVTGALILKRRGSTDPLTWWVVRPLALELDVIAAVDGEAVPRVHTRPSGLVVPGGGDGQAVA